MTKANTIGKLLEHYNIFKKNEYAVVKILKLTIDNLILNVSFHYLFSPAPIIHFKPERGTCPDYHIKL